MAQGEKRLTKELTLKIRKLYLEYLSIDDIKEALEIPDGTWDYWHWNNSDIDGNGQGFRDFYTNCKKERIIRKAESNLEVLMKSDDERIQLNSTTFALETLGKNEGYSKKTETDITSNGNQLQPLLVEIIHEKPTESTNTDGVQ